MLKKYIYLFFIILFSSSLAAKDVDYDILSIYGQYSRPSRAYLDDPDIDNSWGGGIGYNHFIFSYSPFFSGYRVTGSYQFFLHSRVHPYLGFNYVNGTEIYDKPTKNHLDGVTPMVGISVKFFHVVEPYIEQSFVNPYMIYGVRLRFDLHIKHRQTRG